MKRGRGDGGGGMIIRKNGVEIEMGGDDEDFNEEPETIVPISVAALTRRNALISTTCWGCVEDFGPPLDARDTGMATLWGQYTENRGRMEEHKLCDLLAACYEKNIAAPMRKEGKSPMAWGTELIYTHLHTHIVDAVVELLHDITESRTIQHTLSQLMFKKNETTGEMICDYKCVEAHLKTIQAKWARMDKLGKA